MPGYQYNPYEASDAYNVGAYGSTGSRTPASQQNATLQSNGGAKNPHEAFGNLGQEWAQTLQSYLAPKPQAVSMQSVQPQATTQAQAYTQSVMAPQVQQTAAPSQGTTNALDDDAGARYWRRQWFLENIIKGGGDPKNPLIFPGGRIFDQYGQYIETQPVTPTTPGTPPTTTPPDPNAPTQPTPHVDPAPWMPPKPVLGPGTEGGGAPEDQWKREQFNPYADWRARQMYEQAGVKPIEPAIGAQKTFPNGKIGMWDGIGWLHITPGAQGSNIGGW